jgi:hypothetical protein
MAKYTEAEIIQILRDADIPEKDIPLMIAIAMAESKGDPDAVGDVKLANDKWDASIGLFQVRSLRNPEKYSKADKLRIKDKLFDPVYNAKVAYEISKKGKDWSPWSTYNDDSYKEFLPSKSSRSQIRIAGKGKGKPITMADDNQKPTDVNKLVEDLGNFELGSEKLIRLKRATDDEKRRLKRLKVNKQSGIGNVTDAQIEAQTAKVEKAQKEVDDFLTKGKEVDKQREILQESQKKSSKAEKAVKKAEEQLKIAREYSSEGYTGYDIEAAKQKLSDARKVLSDIKIDSDKAQATLTPDTAPFKNPARTTNFDGSPKPVIPKGIGETVYLGDIPTFKEQAIPSFGEKTETRVMSADRNVPQDLETLKRMWFNTDPNAQAIVQRFKDLYASKGKVATQKDWESALNDTAAVNMDNPTQTLWVTAENQINGGGGGTGTGPSAKELKNKRDAVKLLATELGVELTDGQVNSLGYDYANGSIDATTVKSRIASTGNINFATGEAAKTIDSLKATAASYGVSYDPSWYNQSAKDILTGKVDNDTIAQQLKELAKSRYPSLAKQIDAGYTVKQVASPYLQSMANILEINPNDITMEDPTIKQAFTSLNADGQPSTKALWQFEQDLKQDPRWRFTKNAQTDLMGTARKVLQDFGLVY